MTVSRVLTLQSLRFVQMSTKESTAATTKKAKPAALPQTQLQAVMEPAKKFVKDSIKLVKRCTKPDAKGVLKRLASLLARLID